MYDGLVRSKMRLYLAAVHFYQLLYIFLIPGYLAYLLRSLPVVPARFVADGAFSLGPASLETRAT
jgi:hypothetical protein